MLKQRLLMQHREGAFDASALTWELLMQHREGGL
jgi:hypothetical protein